MLHKIDETLSAVNIISKGKFFGLCDWNAVAWGRMLKRAEDGRDATTKEYRVIQNAVRDYYNVLVDTVSTGQIDPESTHLFKLRGKATPREIRAYVKTLDVLDNEITAHLERTKGKSKSAIARPVDMRKLSKIDTKQKRPARDIDGYSNDTSDDGPVIDSSRLVKAPKSASGSKMSSKLNRSGTLGKLRTPEQKQKDKIRVFLATPPNDLKIA